MQTTPKDLKPGSKLLNYLITRKLTSGGMGTVYEGVNESLKDQRVAIKQLHLMDPMIIQKFIQEATLMLAASHPHIPKFYNFFETKGVYYLIMEFIQGKDFRELVYTRQLSLYELLVIMEQVLQAVVYLHTGVLNPQTRTREPVIHRDIKGTNIMVDFASSKPFATLVDLGIASTGQRANMATRIGTTQYAHPLQLAGAPAQPFFDNFSVGATFLEAVMYGFPEDKRLLPVPFLDKSQAGHGQASGEELVAAMLTQSPYLKDPRFGNEAADLVAIIKRCLRFNIANGFSDASILHAEVSNLLARVEKKMGMQPSTPAPTPAQQTGTTAPPPKPAPPTTMHGNIAKDGSSGVWMPITGKKTPRPEDDL